MLKFLMIINDNPTHNNTINLGTFIRDGQTAHIDMGYLYEKDTRLNINGDYIITESDETYNVVPKRIFLDGRYKPYIYSSRLEIKSRYLTDEETAELIKKIKDFQSYVKRISCTFNPSHILPLSDINTDTENNELIVRNNSSIICKSNKINATDFDICKILASNHIIPINYTGE